MGNKERTDGIFKATTPKDEILCKRFPEGFLLSGKIRCAESKTATEGTFCADREVPAGGNAGTELSVPAGGNTGTELSVPAERDTGIELSVRAQQTGKDWTVIITGGTAPHIGCAVLAVPRPSLQGDGKQSSTASVLNVTGHKDEEICRYIAERLASKTGRTVVCTGGVHLDGITPEEIRAVRDMTGKMTENVLEEAVRMETPGTDRRSENAKEEAEKAAHEEREEKEDGTEEKRQSLL